MSEKTDSRWICCQLGAREHYSVPRALFRGGNLRSLITDTWTNPKGLFGSISGKRSRQRYHIDLEDAPVSSWNWSQSLFEVRNRSRRRGWDLITSRNEWFQRKVLSSLETITASRVDCDVVFSYSYTARRPFQFAKKAGLATVLGQIDPGPQEERLVAQLHAASPIIGGMWQPAPSQYWEEWREECEQASIIVVNSEWSRKLLVAEGIPATKLRIVPLVYNPPVDASAYVRRYPSQFTHARPLRVLFLGQINLRKGIGPILDAISLTEGHPIRFRMVGPVQVNLPERIRNHPQIDWVGAVPRGAAAAEYRAADVFLFPTMSDGFGLTQLEAQAWSLPVIASRNCGTVVTDRLNGFVLPTVSPETIASALLTCVAEPEFLQELANASRPPLFGLQSLRDALISCVA